MNPNRHYFVYIMQSVSRHVLYIGVTSKIDKRVFQHKSHLVQGFSSDNNTTRLVYLEQFSDIRTAIAREKQLKGWRREKKNRLIEAINPTYRDLAADWGKPQAPSTPLRSAQDDVSGLGSSK
jgi:putative endonuclease